MPEREVKLTPVPGFRLPALSDVVAGVVAHPDEILDLQAQYYDTADLRLARSGASLRFREPEGWTVKLPAPGDGALLVRGEHMFAGGPERVPAAAVDLVRAWARTATGARTRFAGTALLVMPPPGTRSSPARCSRPSR